MRGEFAIIMPRIRGRTRGLLGPVAQSPCGLVLLDTTAGAAPVVRDLCAELELYARAANITTLRIALEPAFGPAFGAGGATRGRGAAEVLSAITALRSRGLRRIVVVYLAPPSREPARNLSYLTDLGVARPEPDRPDRPDRPDKWAALPDGVRVVVGLASAIGSVAEVVRGVAVVSAGPVACPVVDERAGAWSEPDTPEPGAPDAGTPQTPPALSGGPGGPAREDDHKAQIAHLLMTLPQGELEPGVRAQMIGRLYHWLTATLEAARPARLMRPMRAARPMRPARRARRTWPMTLVWLDDTWDTLLMHLAERDPERAERVLAMTDAHIAAEGGYALGANVRAATFIRPYLDEAAQSAWVRAYGAALASVAVGERAAFRQHASSPMPDGTPPAHAVS